MTADNMQRDVADFISYLHSTNRYQQYTKLVESVSNSQPEHFSRFGNMLLGWSAQALGGDHFSALAEGYARFVQDVTRSQIKYEHRGAYEFSTYKDVYENTYNNEDFMQHYHWGVFVTTFAWPHHLDICRFFHDRFLPRLDNENTSGRCLDLGAGSGVWSMLLLNDKSNWTSQGIDISETSIARAREMSSAVGYSDRLTLTQHDALIFSGEQTYDAAISCFLLEHLEQPELLLKNISSQLNVRSFAFVTGALTAAETDHITEFKNESELVQMAENAGFRVVELLSASPPISIDDKRTYLPRSVALILQKKGNPIW